MGYEKYWEEQGYHLKHKGFLTRRLYLNRRRMGALATLYKAIVVSFCLARLVLRLLFVRKKDIVIIHREICPIGNGRFERWLARSNPNTIFELDDAVWLPMPLKIDQRKLFFADNNVASIMSECAAVVAGNEYIAEYSRKHNKTVAVVPTPYPDIGGQLSSKEVTTAPIIVWIGNVGNDEYLNLLREPLKRLAKVHDFVFRLIGSTESQDLTLDGVNLEFLAWNLESEAKWLKESSIGVMPLFDREYEKGKCSFKLIQYASAGLPLVASPVGMNTEVVSPGINGYLPNSEDEWFDALDLLLKDSEHYRSMAEKSYSMYQQRFSPDKTAKQWVDFLREDLKL